EDTPTEPVPEAEEVAPSRAANPSPVAEPGLASTEPHPAGVAAGRRQEPELVNKVSAYVVREELASSSQVSRGVETFSGGAAGTGASPSGGPNGAAMARASAPDLAARFTKELPKYAAGIETWTTTDTGATKEVTVTIELGDD